MLASFIGFICGILLISGLVFLGVKGNTSLLTWINEENTFRRKQSQTEEEVKKIGVYLLTESIQKGDVIKQEMLKRVDFIDSIVPTNAILDISKIIDQKAALSLEANTLLTSTYLIAPELTEVTADLVEIRDIHIPGVLEAGDIINLRIHFPTGQDYIVLQKKTVDFLNTEENCFYVTLDEEEILSYASAREDILLYPGTTFYISEELRIYKEMDQIDLAAETMEYIEYPLNPNVLQLSMRYSDSEILKQRQFLDERLISFYALEGDKFDYVVDESLTVQSSMGTIEGQDVPNSGTTGDISNETTIGDASVTTTSPGTSTSSGTTTEVTSDQPVTTTEATSDQPVTTTFGF